MALMTGYRHDLQSKLLGGGAEIVLYSGVPDRDETVATVSSVSGVEWISHALFQQALAGSEDHLMGEQVMLKGIEERSPHLPPLMKKIVGPELSFVSADGVAGVAVGSHLARKLGVAKGDAIVLTVPVENAGSLFPRNETLIVSHVFETGFFEFDDRWLFTSLEVATRVTSETSATSVLEIKVAPGFTVDDVMERIDDATGRTHAISDWRHVNRELFSLLAIQQLALFIVIGLIVFVSTFNIVSTLIMTIQEKRQEIGILLSMGAERRLIRRIFVWYGTLVGTVGTMTGILLGTVICKVITRYELVSFGPEIAEVYFVSSIPFLTRPTDLGAIAAFALVVSWLATLIPSARAAMTNPVDGLHHE